MIRNTIRENKSELFPRFLWDERSGVLCKEIYKI